MSQITNKQLQGTILAFTGILMFSTKSVLAKMALSISDDILSVLFLRMAIGFPIVAVITAVTWLKHKEDVKKFYKEYIAVFFLAILGYYISSLFNFSGLRYVSASVERIVLFLYPTFVIILSAIFLKQKISRNQIIAIIVCYVGLLYAFSDQLHLENTEMFWSGIFLIIGSAFTYSIFLTASNKYIPKIGPTMFTNIGLLAISFSIFAHYGIAGKGSVFQLPTSFWVVCGIMSVIGTIIPAYLFNRAIKHLGASNVSILSCIGPIETMVLSSIILSEHITVIQIIGTSIVILGILLLKLKRSDLQKGLVFFYRPKIKTT